MNKPRNSILAWSRVNDLRRLAERTTLEHDAHCRCSLCNEASWDTPRGVRVILHRRPSHRGLLILRINP
jgi:hypothetical protein